MREFAGEGLDGCVFDNERRGVDVFFDFCEVGKLAGEVQFQVGDDGRVVRFRVFRYLFLQVLNFDIQYLLACQQGRIFKAGPRLDSSSSIDWNGAAA